MELATSPASKPPMPSATTKSVSSSPSPTSRASSLFWRTLPASVTPNGCSSRKGKPLLLVPERGRAYPDGVPVPYGCGAHGLAPVHEGAVRRAQILHVEQAAVSGQLRVASRGVVVAPQHDVAARRAAQARLAVTDLEAGRGGQDLRVFDHELGDAVGTGPVGASSVTVPALAWHVGLVVWNFPEVPDAAAHYGADKSEEQEQDQGLRRMKRAVVWPKVSSSPPSIISRSMGAPSSKVPLVEPRSSTRKPLSERESLACLLETLGSFITMSFSCERPTPHGPCPSSGCVSSPKASSTISSARPWRLASSAEMAAVPCSTSPPVSSVRKMRVWPEVSCGAPFSRGPSPPVSLAVTPNSPKRRVSSVSKRILGGVIRW